MNASNEVNSHCRCSFCSVGLNIYGKWDRTAFRYAVPQIWEIPSKYDVVCSNCWTGQAFPLWSRKAGSSEPTYKQAFPKDTVHTPTHLASPSQNQHWLREWPCQSFLSETVQLKAFPLYLVEMLMNGNKIVPSETTFSFHGFLWDFSRKLFWVLTTDGAICGNIWFFFFSFLKL